MGWLRWASIGLLIVSLEINASLRVALIDQFYPPMVHTPQTHLYGLLDLDDDRTPEPYFHGDLVQMVAAHPQLLFLRYPLEVGQPGIPQILMRLQQIQVRFKEFPIDALLLSWESSTLISAFERPLNPDNTKHYKALLREWGLRDPVWQQSWQIIRYLEWLTARDVKVFTIAGNGGTGMVNTFSFAQGVITVGALEPELRHFVANNPLVDRQEKAAYQLVRVDSQKGDVLGYDLTGDNCLDIPLDKFSSGGVNAQDYPKRHWKVLKGSSFSAPAALKAVLVGEHSNQCK